MSCSSCHETPCSCTSVCDPNNEPLNSALNNFITEFFGTVTKTCVDNKVVWTLPCNLAAGAANFPRLPGEGLACYFNRYIMASQGISAYGSFYYTKPPDNAATILPDAAVPFPNNGPAFGGVVRASSSSFYLPQVGDWEIIFSIGWSTTDPGFNGQVMLRLNGVQINGTGSRQRNVFIIRTTVGNSIIELVNPNSNITPLVITSNTGSGNVPRSGWITFKKL